MTGRRYAADTSVPAERTEAELKALLRKHGATGIMIAEHSSYGGAADRLRVAFELNARHIRFDVTLPHPDEERYDRDGGNYRYGGRPAHLRRKAWEQDVRQRWRALLLRIRARLEELEDLETLAAQHLAADPHAQDTAVDLVDLTTRVFLGHILLPEGRTVESWLLPQIAQTYRTGGMPPLLPGATEPPPILLPPASAPKEHHT